MELIHLFIELCIVGLICWGIQQIPGLPQIVKVVVYVLVGIFLLVQLDHGAIGTFRL